MSIEYGSTKYFLKNKSFQNKNIERGKIAGKTWEM